MAPLTTNLFGDPYIPDILITFYEDCKVLDPKFDPGKVKMTIDNDTIKIESRLYFIESVGNTKKPDCRTAHFSASKFSLCMLDGYFENMHQCVEKKGMPCEYVLNLHDNKRACEDECLGPHYRGKVFIDASLPNSTAFV